MLERALIRPKKSTERVFRIGIVTRLAAPQDGFSRGDVWQDIVKSACISLSLVFVCTKQDVRSMCGPASEQWLTMLCSGDYDCNFGVDSDCFFVKLSFWLTPPPPSGMKKIADLAPVRVLTLFRPF
jgi:hypothetical protein